MTTRTSRQKANDDIRRKQFSAVSRTRYTNDCPYSVASPQGKEWQTAQNKRLTQEFLAKGGEITYLPDYDADNDTDYNPAHPHAFEGQR